AGPAAPPCPQELQVHVVNTNFSLSWSCPGGDPGVTFSAEISGSEPSEGGWQELPGCQNVSGTGCDFSSAITEFYDPLSVRVRAGRGGLLSPWAESLDIVPYLTAQIGPPGMQLEATNGGIKIKISPPEANQEKKMWIDELSFKYNLIFWENSSNAQLRSQSVFPIDTIDDLAPETTYCFKVQASLPMESKEGLFSPTQCLRTSPQVRDLLCATNLRVQGLNMKFQLHWETEYQQPVSYNVQYLLGYLKRFTEDYSGSWQGVPSCGDLRGTQCDVSPAMNTSGSYYLRVLARGQGNTSCLSRELRVDPLQANEIGPPGVKLDSSETLLHILISPPGGAEDEAMRDSYVLSYRILYWKNSSNDEEEPQVKETKQTVATVGDLQPGSLYCVRVQALAEPFNKSSAYSQEQCIHTPAEKTFRLVILATFMGALFVVLLVALPLVFILYQAYSKVKYVFFPSCQPPLNIEGFGGELSTHTYLATMEEPVENCSIIESMVTEGNEMNSGACKHSKQSSRDSGNYSNGDNTSRSKGSEETLEKEII
ncbi:INAR1 protein, partial [Serilophus lunatus]|nr:INAR1 protein [Serilophus lunatus]